MDKITRNGIDENPLLVARRMVDQSLKTTGLPVKADADQVWYEVQYSLRGAENWYSSSSTADTIEGIRRKLEGFDLAQNKFEYRVVRRVLTTEVVPQ